MSKGEKKDRSVMIVVAITIILIVIIGYTSKQREQITTVEKWVGNIIAPIQGFVSKGTNFMAQGLGSIVNLSKIKRENEILTEEIEKLTDELVTLRLNREELEELRGLKFALNYVTDNNSFKPVAANIIGKSPSNWFNIFTIDAGENQNITKNSIVVASSGLIGRVYEVGGNWSKVVSIIDNNSSVSFQVLRHGNYQGILSGSISNELEGYLFDAQAEVVVGDKLITSGVGIYPKGIIIGEVIEVFKSSDQLLKKIKIEPAVNFKRLNKVLVIQPTIKTNIDLIDQ